MSLRLAPAALLLAVSAAAAFASASEPWLLARTAPGESLEIRTSLRVYRVQVVDPASGETRTTVSLDGQRFPAPATVYILGATAGPQNRAGQSLVKMGRVEPGLRMELGLGSRDPEDRALSAAVTEIRRLGQ